MYIIFKGFGVQSSYKFKLPPPLIVQAANIKMTEIIGQGKLNFALSSNHYFFECSRGIWYGLQRTSFGGWGDYSHRNGGDKNSKR